MIEWRPVVGAEGVYEVSTEGQIRRVSRGRATRPGFVLSPIRINNGYMQVKISGGSATIFKRRSVHAIVAEALLGPRPDGYQVNHKDGVKDHNALSNLEYVTPRQNQLHTVSTGLRSIGSEMKNAKLGDVEIRSARVLNSQFGFSKRSIARALGVSYTTLSSAMSGKTWVHLAVGPVTRGPPRKRKRPVIE